MVADDGAVGKVVVVVEVRAAESRRADRDLQMPRWRRRKGSLLLNENELALG